MSRMIKTNQLNLTCLRPRKGQFITFLVGVAYLLKNWRTMAMDAYGCELENLNSTDASDLYPAIAAGSVTYKFKQLSYNL